ncbi:MAG: GNAT family N-acetyltransferase [Pyrinomonadaceae bacterium]
MTISILCIDRSSPFLIDVKTLGKRNSSTLGFFPDGAFDDHAQRKQILVAVDEGGRFAGYLLYRVSRRIARITHLCVDETARGLGVSRGLIDELKTITSDLIGISLKCRLDYAANDLWPRYNFVPMRQTKGRGREPKTLVHWWFDHGHPTLFDRANLESERKIRAVIDANILFDLFDESRDGHDESKFLQAAWLSDLLELRVCDETLNEINRNPDELDRERSLENALTVTVLPNNPHDIERAYAEISPLHPKTPDTRTAQDESDLRQLAGTLSANVSYFVTRDEAMLRAGFVSPLNERYGLHILRPADFVRQIEQIENSDAYQPARLGGTAIRMERAAPGSEAQLSDRYHQLEGAVNFRRRLRALQADVECCSVSLVSSLDTSLAIIGLLQKQAERLRVPILRVARGKLSHTLSAHLILHLVDESIGRGCSAVEVSDPHLSEQLAELLVDEGFVENDDGTFVKFHLPFISSFGNLDSLLANLPSASKNEAELIGNTKSLQRFTPEQISPSVFGDLETTFFPLKIFDAGLEAFLVPIRPEWARELFDVGLARQGLFPADEALALRKEQAFYRSNRNSAGIRAPARILWYVSKGSSRGYADVGAVRACSLLRDVVVGTPKELFKRYQRLGIYTWDDVRSINPDNLDEDVMVLLFGNTETFVHPVDLDQLYDLKDRFQWKMQLAGVSRVPPKIFAEIYSRGQNRTYDPNY